MIVLLNVYVVVGVEVGVGVGVGVFTELVNKCHCVGGCRGKCSCWCS